MHLAKQNAQADAKMYAAQASLINFVFSPHVTPQSSSRYIPRGWIPRSHPTPFLDLFVAFFQNKSQREAESNRMLLTPEFLKLEAMRAIGNTTKVYFGDHLPKLFVDPSWLSGGAGA